MEVFWLTTLLFAMSVFIVAYLLLSWLVEAVTWLLYHHRRRIPRILELTSGAGKVQTRQPDNLAEDRIHWPYVYALSLLTGLGVYLFTQQMMALFLAVVPFAVRVWLDNYRKRRQNDEALAFLMDVRIALPLQGSLLRALQEVARRGSTRLAQLTARYLGSGFQGSGLELLDRLAQATRLPSLADLVAWTHAAEAGTLASDAPFEHALSRLRSEMYTAAREQMQRIPTRLTVLVLPALLGPTIVVLLYPVVARLLAGMGGAGWNGGF
jgi:hypothetical protein